MTPEQQQAGMQAWMDWVQKGTKEGWLLDPGRPLMGPAAVVSGDSVTDGPFAESKELVGGYMIVQVDDLAAACELAKQTIQLTAAGQIEVRHCAEMG